MGAAVSPEAGNVTAQSDATQWQQGPSPATVPYNYRVCMQGVL